MNLPNKLTVLRIILTPIFMLTLVWNFPFHYLVSLLIFIGASLTDLLDGKIARKRGLVTDFGKFLDPLADKMLTTAAFLGFIALDIGYGAVWIAFIVLLREFMVSSIRLIASTSGGKVIAANIWGKLKTVFQMVAIIFALTAKQFTEILAMLSVKAEILNAFSSVLGVATSVLLWISAILCVISGVIYLIDNKDFVSQTK
ncbi:MAG: CDP-diacylglycerol--glycerol-3-phosphate 3-phosphatidyltransferase [Clostridia bacterium]|nr:CDP-diacylglycerol--glycerol-3-phosphate 3-phosphatidyltransferase [Clostridia bacterium]